MPVTLPMLTITPLYVALTVALVVVLAMTTVHHRIENQVSLGTGGVEALERAARAHGNLVEYAPIVLILLAILELNGLPHWQLHLFGLAFIAARVSHAYGLIKGIIPPRSLGALSTLIIIMAMTGLTLVQLVF